MEWHGGRIRAGQGGQRGGGRRTRRAGGGVEGEGAGVLTVPLVLTLLKKDMSAVIACSRQARRKKRGGGGGREVRVVSWVVDEESMANGEAPQRQRRGAANAIMWSRILCASSMCIDKMSRSNSGEQWSKRRGSGVRS